MKEINLIKFKWNDNLTGFTSEHAFDANDQRDSFRTIIQL